MSIGNGPRPESAARGVPDQGSDADGAGHARSGRRRSQEAHDAVMAATLELLEEVGYQRLTIDAVAARAGVGKATVYRWWPAKPQLVVEALERTTGPVEISLSGDSRADIRTMIDRMAHVYATTVLGEGLAGLAADAARDSATADRLRAMIGPRRAADGAVLMAAAGRGDLPHDLDVGLVLDILFGTLLFRRMLGAPFDPGIVDHLTDLITSGAMPTTAPRGHA